MESDKAGDRFAIYRRAVLLVVLSLALVLRYTSFDGEDSWVAASRPQALAMVREHSEATIAKLRLTLPHRASGLFHHLRSNGALGSSRATEMNPTVDNVPAAVARISATPRSVPCDPGAFTVPTGGHLQGIQQATILGRPYIILSGSASTHSYLALVQMENGAGRVTAIKPLLDRPFKHAGGFQVCGDYLAVGIEDDTARNTSKVWILRLEDLLQEARPKPTIEIQRRGAYKRATAGAVALAKVRERHLLCVGTWDSATIDIYRSNGKPLEDPNCALNVVETWDATQADRSDWSDPDYASYQNINLIVDANDRVFLAGLARVNNEDVIDLFEFRPKRAFSAKQRLKKTLRHTVHSSQGGFQNGAGLVVEDADTLTALTCGHRHFVIEHFDTTIP